MKILSTIWSYITDPKSRNIIFVIIIFILGVLLLQQCRATTQAKQTAKTQQVINDQNNKAKDSVQTTAKNKAGDIEALKFAFVSQIADLKKLNDSLYLESKKEIGKLEGIIKSNVIIQSQSVTVSNSVSRIDSETYGLNFTSTKIDTNFEWDIAGISKFKLINNIITPGTTEIAKNNIKIGIVLGFTQQTDGYHVFARSSSPDVQFSQLNGALIIPPSNTKNDILCPPVPPVKKFGVGPYIGVGLDNDLKPGLSVGIAFTYSIIRF
jgi:hypothetical protein